MIELKDKFIGSLLGTFAGDALGMPVEGYSHHTIKSQFNRACQMMEARLGKGTYTDDTEMMIAVAESLIACKGFNGPHMAQCFLDNFHLERGYGAGTIKALSLIKSGTAWNQAGKMVFDGGSFGNGAAMRISPVAVLYYDNIKTLRTIASKSSLITHAHLLGKEGALLQAYAMSLAMQLKAEDIFDASHFLNNLINFLLPEARVYMEKLAIIGKLLGKDTDLEIIINQLGNDSSAPNSVPTAIYCFLSHPHSFEDALVYAVGLGGDTDTIAAMTGAISGAYHGKNAIPTQWLGDLENGEKGRDYIEQLAIQLWKLKTQIR
ncbi:MAG: ADP-ribosylglycohydrolase family protein [Deltaproteobacteria bacterium]|nr:ADP-ribosylglycohydrolase family protein [Deltaproteobacteria bacterium]